MREDEGVENELRDWLEAIPDAQFNHYIPPRLVKDAIKAIGDARRLGLLEVERSREAMRLTRLKEQIRELQKQVRYAEHGVNCPAAYEEGGCVASPDCGRIS